MCISVYFFLHLSLILSRRCRHHHHHHLFFRLQIEHCIYYTHNTMLPYLDSQHHKKQNTQITQFTSKFIGTGTHTHRLTLTLAKAEEVADTTATAAAAAAASASANII